MLRHTWRAFLRFAFHLFYNQFAFTYDWVSALVSRGHWREWTRAALPRIAGTRVLELPCGTGNLQLDLIAAGYAPIGADLSFAMLQITRRKLDRAGNPARLIRARAQELPFARGAFDSIVMTFPPSFVYDPRVFVEMHRILNAGGRLIWVDGGRLLKRDVWDRALDTALDAVGGEASRSEAEALLVRAGFAARVESIQDTASAVVVITATKEKSGNQD